MLAYHEVESHRSQAFTINTAKWVGFSGLLGRGLVRMRIQEAEANHMGLMIMADADFDPQACVEHVI